MKDIKVLYGIDVDCVAGCIDSLEDYIVNKYLVQFLSDNEKTTFKFFTGDSNEVLKMMENHEVELGIVRYPFNNERYNSVTLTDDKFIILIFNRPIDIFSKILSIVRLNISIHHEKNERTCYYGLS